jgi:hypothetical protein
MCWRAAEARFAGAVLAGGGGGRGCRRAAEDLAAGDDAAATVVRRWQATTRRQRRCGAGDGAAATMVRRGAAVGQPDGVGFAPRVRKRLSPGWWNRPGKKKALYTPTPLVSGRGSNRD